MTDIILIILKAKEYYLMWKWNNIIEPDCSAILKLSQIHRSTDV